MRGSKFNLLLNLVCLWAWTSLHAQESTCKNLGFELGNFTNWTGFTWRQSAMVPSINTNKVQGIVNRRHTIMSDTSAYDANTGYALRKIPRGYLYSARLGDEIIRSSDGIPRCWQQSLRYTMTIDSSNALLILRFALVLQYAWDHNAINEPRFKLTLFDSKGDTIRDCANYDVYSSNKIVKGFKSYTPAGSNDPVQWRDWTTVGANLLKYVGQTITVEFMTADCLQRYHYGYAYFIAECNPLYISVKYCANDTIASLIAPEGFERYKWTFSGATAKDTLQTLKVRIPLIKSSYSCTMTSATGCVVTLQTAIAKYIPKASFSSFMLDCTSNTVQFTNFSTTTNGTLLYRWIFGDGNTSNMKNPPYTFSTSGMHRVTLLLNNPPSTCADTLTRVVESFSPPLVGIGGDSTYCPGLSTTLRAYGAYDYTWSNGSKSGSIEMSAPGGKVWLIGRSSTGCVSDTIYKTITEEPDWEFYTHGDTTICGKRSVVLSASGAAGYIWNRKVILSSSGSVSYLWNKGIANDSLTITTPGTYVVTGANTRGCEKSRILNVVGYPLPGVDFSISPTSLDNRHNTIIINVPTQNGVKYAWNLGDGSSGTGSTIQHTYNISNSVLQYRISLAATSPQNCRDSSFRFVDVVPFVPNVFSPNGDGINDVFMSDFKLEIFDRNGLKIFKGTNGWDGYYNGQPADPDTYFYLIYYEDSKQIIHALKGYVILVR